MSVMMLQDVNKVSEYFRCLLQDNFTNVGYSSPYGSRTFSRIAEIPDHYRKSVYSTEILSDVRNPENENEHVKNEVKTCCQTENRQPEDTRGCNRVKVGV